MNNLVAGEFEKLTPFQQAKFHEYCAWQTNGNQGQQLMSDSALFKIIEWCQRLEEEPEPAPIQEEECSESPQEQKKPSTE